MHEYSLCKTFYLLFFATLSKTLWLCQKVYVDHLSFFFLSFNKIPYFKLISLWAIFPSPLLPETVIQMHGRFLWYSSFKIPKQTSFPATPLLPLIVSLSYSRSSPLRLQTILELPTMLKIVFPKDFLPCLELPIMLKIVFPKE